MGSCSRRREDEGSENPGFYKRVDRLLCSSKKEALKDIGHAKFNVEIYGLNRCNKMSKARKSDRLLDDHDVIVVDSDSNSEIEFPREPVCGRKLSRRGRPHNLATVNRSGNPCFSVQMCQTHVTKGPLH
ncbi:hypothetical protein ABKV19_001993 [Rosa sericea]